MQFKKIPGKEKEKYHLIHIANEGRIPHANLFLGKEGTSALPLALAFASYILCTNRQENDSCGTCKNCSQSHKLIHPDLHFSFPVVKYDKHKNRADSTSDDFMPQWRQTLTKDFDFNVSDWLQEIHAENSLPNINVKECNEIILKLGMQAFSDGPKILIMWMPEYLGKEGNRLLKLIEEPTPNTYIIFIAEDQERILPTILSRCQLLKIHHYTDNEIIEFLTTQYNVTNTIAVQIATIAQGNMNKAKKLANGDELDMSELLFDWLRTCYKGNAIEISEKINVLSAWTKDQRIQFYEYGIHFFRSFLFWINTGSVSCGLTEKELEVAERMKKILDMKKIEKLYNILNKSILHIVRNGNFKINFTADCIKIGDILLAKS